METLEVLATRLHTTNEIQSIVSTMKALSTANIRQYEHAVTAMADYERTITMGLQVVLRNCRNWREPISAAHWAFGAGKRRALIVIGSDRGLCGHFNDKIAEFAHAELASAPHTTDTASAASPFLCVVGVRAAARMEAFGYQVEQLFTLPGSVDGLVESVQSIVIEVDRWIREEAVGPVTLFFNQKTERSLATAVTKTLLPISQAYLDTLAQEPWHSRRLPMFRMEPEKLFSWLVRQLLFIDLYGALAQSLASEHASRLAAMQNAERNIDERHDDLLAQYRQKRQETITQELLEVVSGFEAIKEKG